MNELETIDTILVRLKESQNGERPAALRDLGAALAGLDVPAWLDVKAGLPERSGLKTADLDALRADGLKRTDEASRARAALAAAAAGETEAKPGYLALRGMAGTPILCYRRLTADGPVTQTLAYFVPRVIGERLRHRADGNHERVLICELTTARGVTTFEALPDDLADARRFYAACLNAVGADAKLATAAAVKHLTTAALELAADERERAEVFEFTGWHEVNGGLVYLSAGGAIGADHALTVDLTWLAHGAGVPGLATFGPVDRGDAALSAGLAALAGPVRRSFPDLVMLPGLAAVGLAPLLRWVSRPDLPALHYIGTTGTRKSALLGILQAFYGLDVPALSWRGTANSIEIAASALRDCLVTVDDLKTSTSDRGAGVKVIQSYADRRGRTRGTRTGGLTQARFMAGLLVSAGEDIPSGEASIAARALFVPVGAKDANLAELSLAQAAAGHLATVTARYIGWLQGRQADIGKRFEAMFKAARDHYRRLLANHKGLNDAGRVATNCALLDVGMGTLCEWLLTQGWSNETATGLIRSTRGALENLARQQAQAIGEESAAGAFIGALRALLDARRVELVNVSEGDASLPALAESSPRAAMSTIIGWQQGQILYLQPELTIAEVRNWLSKQGRALPTERGLYAQLRDGGYLSRTSDKTTVQLWAGRRNQRVLALSASALEDPTEDAEKEKNAQEGSNTC